ncbi:RNA pseudouridine synthase [Ceratobasidium sp. AG-Ba]|nr:RNA pseudouridine synthase [Ceratobasidium sp. AG-Ba]
MSELPEDAKPPTPLAPSDLKDIRVPMYWHPYRTMAKQRWWGREILELVSTEFRDRSIEYYRYALESEMVHRHEIPVTSTPVKILHRDDEHGFIVIDKPGSIPVHATGRYFKNSLVEILKRDFGIPVPYTRKTSCKQARPPNIWMHDYCAHGRACKAPLQRVHSRNRSERIYYEMSRRVSYEQVIVEEPLLCVDRQMGLNIVHPEGKHAKTVFNRLFYDPVSNTSVLHCQPLTGRSHQIRVHLQYIGHPVANDPVYQNVRVWGPRNGKGGVSLIPSEERQAPQPPTESAYKLPDVLPESSKLPLPTESVDGVTASLAEASITRDTLTLLQSTLRLLIQDTSSSRNWKGYWDVISCPLSAEAVGIITRLRNMKDESEDWGRWRDVIFRAKKALNPVVERERERDAKEKQEGASTRVEEMASFAAEQPSGFETEDKVPEQIAVAEDGSLYCTECYLPLRPDPKPESLYISCMR